MSDDGSADNIYINVIMNGSSPKYNPNPIIAPTGESGVLAEYKVTKTSPFLDNPSEYYCSVIRFVVPLQLIPLFIMPIIPQQGNPNLSTLILGFDLGPPIVPIRTRISTYVLYYPDNNMVAPQQNSPQQIITPYYYVYTYSHMINMLNVTLKTLWTTVVPGLISSDGTLSGLYPALRPPFFDYDPTTQLISLIIPFIFLSGTTATNGQALLFMNNASLQFLEAFHLAFQGYDQPNGEDFIFVNVDTPQFYYPTPGVPSTPQYYQYIQDYNTLYYWTSLRKLIFSSQTLPINNEIVPTKNNTGVYLSFPIITDFVISTEQAGQSRSLAVYNPQGQYRLISLSGNSPISLIDITIFWQDQQGNLYPLYIPQNQQASMKLGFFKKSLYNSTSNTRKV